MSLSRSSLSLLTLAFLYSFGPMMQQKDDGKSQLIGSSKIDRYFLKMLIVWRERTWQPVRRKKKNQWKLDFEKTFVQGEVKQFNTVPWWDFFTNATFMCYISRLQC